jgi:cytochrome c553
LFKHFEINQLLLENLMTVSKCKFIAGVFLFSISVVSHALTLSSNSFNLNIGDSVTVQLSQINGSVSYKNSNTSLVSVSKISTSQYNIKVFKSGTSKITFKDSKGSAAVTVTVASSTATATALNGRLLSSNCFQCHGTNGSGGFEKLSGSSEAEILSELREFASGKEDSTGIMAAHTMGYSDAQLQMIAKYFSTIKQ